MNRNHLEEKLKRAFSAAAPDSQEQILRRCGPREGAVIPMAPAPRPRRRLAGAAAAVLLLCAVLAGGAWQVQHTVASTVSLDVNPSIGIQVNRRQRVLQVTPLNDDGAAVVGNMDFSGSTLEVTVNALIGSMLRGGYLTDLANSILVSVDDADQDRAARLRQQLSDEIAALLQTDGFSGAVLSQTITADRELQELAQSNSITPGKAQLIRQITAQNSFYSFEELAGLSINQLNLLNSSLDNVSYRGQASDKAYIGSDAALQAALDHAGVLPEAAACCEAELDFDDGVMLYEVAFRAGGVRYQYEIDARTGRVLKCESDQVRQETPAEGSVSGRLTAEDALLAALVHAGLAQYSVDFGEEWELDTHHGVPVYEIEFHYGGFAYEYEIDVYTGAVVKYGREAERDHPEANAGAAVSTRAARQAALAHAGVSENDVTTYDCELEDGVYEIEFEAGGYCYSYEISPADGSVLEHELERID